MGWQQWQGGLNIVIFIVEVKNYMFVVRNVPAAAPSPWSPTRRYSADAGTMPWALPWRLAIAEAPPCIGCPLAEARSCWEFIFQPQLSLATTKNGTSSERVTNEGRFKAHFSHGSRKGVSEKRKTWSRSSLSMIHGNGLQNTDRHRERTRN